MKKSLSACSRSCKTQHWSSTLRTLPVSPSAAEQSQPQILEFQPEGTAYPALIGHPGMQPRQACSPVVVDNSRTTGVLLALLLGCAKSGAALKAVMHMREQTCTRSWLPSARAANNVQHTTNLSAVLMISGLGGTEVDTGSPATCANNAPPKRSR